MIKSLSLFLVFIWFRGTFPRFRIDQVMAFSWKFLLPLSMINVFIVAIDYYITGIAGFVLSWVAMLASFFAVWAINSKEAPRAYVSGLPAPANPPAGSVTAA